MKKVLLFSAVLLLGGLIRCNETDETPVQVQSIPKTKTSSTAGRSASNTFHEGVGAPISYETAQRWIKNFKKKNPGTTESHFFGTDTFHRLLDNPECVGISIHYALDENGKPQLLLVGIDENGKIIAENHEGGKSAEDDKPVFEDASSPCPPVCPTSIF